MVAGIGVQWEWGVEDKNGDAPLASLFLPSPRSSLPSRFAHADGPTSLTRAAAVDGATQAERVAGWR